MRTTILFLVACTPLFGQMTVDEVIAKHKKARGGERWQSVKTMTLKGSYIAFSKPNPFVLHKQWSDKIRFEHVLVESDTVIASDGEKVWWINPNRGSSEPEWVSGLDALVQAQDTPFLTPFFTHEEDGFGVTYKGIGEVEGSEGHLLELERAPGHIETWVIDAETFLETARQSPGSDYGRPFDQFTFFDDFREHDGIMVPYLVERIWHTRRRLMEVSDVILNPELDGTLFEKPLPTHIKPLAGMVGDWEVDAGFSARQTDEYQSFPTSSTIVLSAGSRLLTEKTEALGFRGPMEIYRTLSYDANREAYVMTTFNTMTNHMNVLRGSLEEGILTLDNTESGTSWGMRPGQEIYDKVVISGIGEQGFRLEAFISVDKGANWLPFQRCDYSRPGASGTSD